MKTVWLGRGVSNNVELIELLRGVGLFVAVSHHVDTWAGQQHADRSFQEPDVSGDEYVQWTAQMLRENNFDAFIPGRCLGDFERFPLDVMPKLLTGCSPQTINTLDDKALFYQLCQKAQLKSVADFEVFSTVEQFKKGYETLKSLGHETLCFKPVKGVYARGFRILTNRNPLDVIEHHGPYNIQPKDFVRWLEENPDYTLEPMVLMPLFNGKEYSVDGSFDGEHYRFVARQKNGTAGQVIETNPVLYDTALEIAKLFGLRGIFNIQLMDHHGSPMVLEVNPRPAGGMGASRLSDVAIVVPEIFNSIPVPSDVSMIVPQHRQEIISESHYMLKNPPPKQKLGM